MVAGVQRTVHQGTDTNSSGIYGHVSPVKKKKNMQGQTRSQLPSVQFNPTVCAITNYNCLKNDNSEDCHVFEKETAVINCSCCTVFIIHIKA